jgi:uncharacterized protein YqfB (UPF0267 family)
MVAYSFKARFGPLIRSGAKTQTVRADRKRHARPGEALQLYTGMRTRSCTLLATATCVAVWAIRFDFRAGQEMVMVHGHPALWPSELDHFAQRDGFADWADLKAFWVKEHAGLETFDGVMISWADVVLP